MTEQQASLAAIEAAIEAAFDGRWGIWRSDTGWWWATRTNPLTADELANGCAPFIHADNPDELHERVRQQDELTRSILESTNQIGPADGAARPGPGQDGEYPLIHHVLDSKSLGMTPSGEHPAVRRGDLYANASSRSHRTTQHERDLPR
jgi:hypothetical protein